MRRYRLDRPASCGWLAGELIEGDDRFFAITKRIHNGLYGSAGDGGALGARERRHYEDVMRRNAREVLALARPGDLGLIHDPQPAGLASALTAAGVRVVWHCHVGLDVPNRWTPRAWEFLRPYLEDVETYVVSRPEFAPPWAGRVHLACMSMADSDEAAAMVNALQRHAAVVVQKSLAEGFGLTVTEAMWKSRPVVGSAVGGIADQIVHGDHGLLVGDPYDLAGFGAAVETLLRDPAAADRLGRNARVRATAEYLGDRHLEQYGELFAALV